MIDTRPQNLQPLLLWYRLPSTPVCTTLYKSGSGGPKSSIGIWILNDNTCKDRGPMPLQTSSHTLPFHNALQLSTLRSYYCPNSQLAFSTSFSTPSTWHHHDHHYHLRAPDQLANIPINPLNFTNTGGFTIMRFLHLKSLQATKVREGSGYQIGWIFGKIPNSFRPLPLIFGKLYCKFYMTDMVA